MVDNKKIEILQNAQEYIAKNYSSILICDEDKSKVSIFIEKYVQDNNIQIDGMSSEDIVSWLYLEMCSYSFLSKYLDSDAVDEININSWDDVVVTWSNGRIEKVKEKFLSPVHAEDVIKRLLSHSGMTIDNAMPIAQGHLPNNVRITAIKNPVVDKDVGIAVSIRMLHPQRINKDTLVKDQMMTLEMIEFLEMCIRYGVSTVIAGRTSSGKTTLLNTLLCSIPDEKRIFTIESGARELSLIKRDGMGNIENNVVHTLSRPSDKEQYDVSQEDLVVGALRFNPDLIAIGEIRDKEASAAVEASLTGHTVITSVHAGAGASAHGRIALLCQRRFQLGMDVSLDQCREAFPIVVFTHRLENGERKIMDIEECVKNMHGDYEYKCLYRYNVANTQLDDGTKGGFFEKVSKPSNELRLMLLRCGVPVEELRKFVKGDYIY